MGARYNIDKERLKKLTKLSKDQTNRMPAKLMQELSILKAQEDMSLAKMSKETMIKIRDYLLELVSYERATKADQARLMIIQERLSI